MKYCQCAKVKKCDKPLKPGPKPKPKNKKYNSK